MIYVCPKCKNDIKLDETLCGNCGQEYFYKEKNFFYNFDNLLFSRYKSKYLLNKSLNNNGFLSYEFLKEGSLSLSTRSDVKNFKEFIRTSIGEINSEVKLLDIGCGTLEFPGYLEFEDVNNVNFYGIEPIKNSQFRENLITGCSEFIPLKNNSINVVIFATSLDHVCSIEDTISEVNRVLTDNGQVIIWMSDRSMSFVTKLKSKLRIIYDYLKLGYRTDIYKIYDNGIILEIPRGGIDPFHSFFESPKLIEKKFNSQGFKIDNIKYNNRDEVFLQLSKVN